MVVLEVQEEVEELQSLEVHRALEEASDESEVVVQTSMEFAQAGTEAEMVLEEVDVCVDLHELYVVVHMTVPSLIYC